MKPVPVAIIVWQHVLMERFGPGVIMIVDNLVTILFYVNLAQYKYQVLPGAILVPGFFIVWQLKLLEHSGLGGAIQMEKLVMERLYNEVVQYKYQAQPGMM
jgi:hypothetical protein